MLIIAPLGQDAAAMADVLEKTGFRTAICDGVSHACKEMTKKASALLMTEEALEMPQVPQMLELLKAQPPWSELPVIILTSGGETRFSKLLDLVAAAAGSVTILERPLGSATLLRSVEVALRSRRRQYEVRDLLEEQEGKQRELQALKDHLASDLEAMRRMHRVASLNVQREGPFRDVLQEIIEAAASITGTTKGTLQLRDVSTGELKMTAQTGFKRPFLEFFDVVRVSDTCVCGQALQNGERVIVEDVTEHKAMADSRALDVLLRAGVRAVQSTPLRSRSGSLLGMISTHFGEPHHPSTQELRFVDLLARQAADIIERQQSEQAVREGELRYRTLFNSIDEGFCVVEMIFNSENLPKDYRFLEVNPAFERQTGLTGPVGKRMRELVPEHEDEWYQIFGRVALTGRPVRFQNRAQALHRWYDVYAFRVGRAENKRVAVLFTDITARKEAQEMNARLAAIVESSEDAIISKDLSGIILSWNHGAERVFGYTAEEVLGKPVTILIPPDHLDEEPKILARIRRGEPIEHYETVRRRKDGSLIDISLTVSPIKDGTGKVIGASKIARDISGNKQAIEDLRRSEERYRTLVEQVKDYAIFSMDASGHPTSWNEGVQRVLGFAEEEFIGKDIVTTIFTPEDVAADRGPGVANCKGKGQRLG
nr:chemotaxis protein methyltransferase CheR [uncultured bacterium]